MLGCPGDALAEINYLSAEARLQTQALDLEWQAASELKNWDQAFLIASRHVDLFPGALEAWIHQAYAARRKPGGSVELAFGLLQPAFGLFETEFLVPFNLACYAAQLGRFEEASRWLKDAAIRGNRAEVRRMAEKDSDLIDLRDRLDAIFNGKL